jgi:ribosomal protein S18 acetylase RimI-like enzyme
MSRSAILRSAFDRDSEAIAVLAKQFSLENPSASVSSAEDLKKLNAAVPAIISSSGTNVVVAERSGAVIGLVTFSLIPSLVHATRVTLFVDLLVVDVHHRRQGVGTSLVDYIVKKSTELNAYKILLISREDNSAARALYQKFSFAVNGLGFARYVA